LLFVNRKISRAIKSVEIQRRIII